jgi:hypothetical protein
MVLRKRAPNHLYARAYRAVLTARHLLQDPNRFFAEFPDEQCRGTWDVPSLAYELATRVSAALAALPEFPLDRRDAIEAACWKLNPKTKVRGSVSVVDATLAELHRLGEEAAREEAGATAIVRANGER